MGRIPQTSEFPLFLGENWREWPFLWVLKWELLVHFLQENIQKDLSSYQDERKVPPEH